MCLSYPDNNRPTEADIPSMYRLRFKRIGMTMMNMTTEYNMESNGSHVTQKIQLKIPTLFDGVQAILASS